MVKFELRTSEFKSRWAQFSHTFQPRGKSKLGEIRWPTSPPRGWSGATSPRCTVSSYPALSLPGSSAYSPPDAFKVSIPIRNNYMYARVRKALPELYAFTACMWLRSRSGGSGQGTPFSYSVPGQANEIVLLEAGLEPMELLINDKVGGSRILGRVQGLHFLSAMRIDTFTLLFTILYTHLTPTVCQVQFWPYRQSRCRAG